MTKIQQKTARTFEGIVMSDSQSKTIVVKVDRTIVHSKYGKRFVRSQKYQVHDEKSQFHVGDKVSFVECRPLSRTKRWRVVGIKSENVS